MTVMLKRNRELRNRVNHSVCAAGMLFMFSMGLLGCTTPREEPYAGNKEFPPDLVAKARKVLHGRIDVAWEYGYDWLDGKLALFSTNRDEHVMYLHRDDEYLLVHSKKGDYSVLNEILSEYTFARREFNDPEEVDYFLGLLVSLWEGPDRYIGSSVLIRVLEACEEIEGWLRGRENDEAVFRYLCRDPVFVFDQDRWTVVWNVFRVDGRVEQWCAVGQFDDKTQTNRIQSIAKRILKRPGTFTSAMMGG